MLEKLISEIQHACFSSVVIKWGHAYPLRYAKVLQRVHKFF